MHVPFVSLSFLVCVCAFSSLRDIPIAGSLPPLYLDGVWSVASAPLGLELNGSVPGDILSDLQRGGVIGDPYYELNFLDNRTLWAQAAAWRYSTAVTLPPPGSTPGSSLVLVFEGIKMGASISLNGVFLGNATNQFVRYTFPLPAAAIVAGGANLVEVAFDPFLSLAGRYMACSGGSDWAPISTLYLNDTFFGTMAYFSSGIWKSVYVATLAPASVAITAVKPLPAYLGAYPVGALVEGAHAGFTVNVTVYLWAPPGGAQGTLSVAGAWAGGAASSPFVQLPPGDSNITLTLAAPAAAILLWWPNGLGAQNLYNVSAAWTPGGPGATTVSSFRRLGFRVAALVTLNDTNATLVAESVGASGSGSGFSMFFRINGAALYARGGNVVPMEELEGRLDAGAYATLVASAAAANMNMMRVWGGGIYPPDAFYEACDEHGILLYHDLQFARGTFPQPLPAAAEASIRGEITHQARRLSHHPSIVLYDSNNEDVVQASGPTALYSTLIMTALATEDSSRIVWPNSPSAGWRSGVHTLYGTPNGEPLVALGGGHAWVAGNEWHRFYQAGVGAWNWSTVVSDPWTQAHTFDPQMPLPGLSPSAIGGVERPGFFVSEFGSTSMSSFESMAGTLAPGSLGLHGGNIPSNCSKPPAGAFYANCTGGNAMAQRNWACDNLVWSYFGAALLNASGELGFKGGLFQCMISAALNMQSVVEQHRGANVLGTLEWQLNEIWPTGGWGSLEYGSAASPGSLRGGRWKPMHYWFANHIFADVMAACGPSGKAFACYVNNARSGAGFEGTLTLSTVDLRTGASGVWASFPVSVSAGPGALAWVSVPSNATALPNATTTLLVAKLLEKGGNSAFDEHIVHLTAPQHLAVPRATLLATVAAAPNADGSVDIAVSTDNVAIFVVLTAAAPGRFSDNAFLLLPAASPRTLQWLPFAPGDAAADWALLKASLRIEDHSAYVSTL